MTKERFVIYVDIGPMPKVKADQYLQEFKERWVMDATLRGDDAWWYFVPICNSHDGRAIRVERL